ncbi:MAG TPA: helix-turn-helix domain-containing protein [Candidatus Eisenbacteria bacterium]|nr:helix-turn-helix domain-containing protein [Candidatus Eisenbacteria bacterium]
MREAGSFSPAVAPPADGGSAEARRSERRPDSPGLWRLRETAAYLSISERQVRREVAAKRLRCVRIGRRLLFDPKDVSRFVAAAKE